MADEDKTTEDTEESEVETESVEVTEPEADEESTEDAGAVALADAAATIETLTASIADQAAEILRLQGVNYALLEQVSAGDTTDDLFTEDGDTEDNEDPESVDDALESHRIEED